MGQIFSFDDIENMPDVRQEQTTIEAETALTEILRVYPEAKRVLSSYGMHCLDCHAARFENLGQASAVHGLDTELVIDEILAEIEFSAF